MMRENLSAGLDIYHTMNQLPFVNLPVPSQEKVDQVGESIEESTLRCTNSNRRSLRSALVQVIGLIESDREPIYSPQE